MSGIYHIRDFGAMAQELCTTYIQSAIDTCAASGGGTVVVSDGTYVTGTIFMKSNVHLRIEGGARLLFARSFKSATGKTFKEYLNITRMNEAEQLLVSTTLPISEIATRCGYNSASYFTSLYKQYKDKTPCSERKSNKK